MTRVGLSLLTVRPGKVGGAESYVRGLLRAYHAGPHETVVLGNRAIVEAYRDRVGGATSLRHLPGLEPEGGTAKRAAALARATVKRLPDGFDVVHYPVAVALPRTHRPTVVTLHDIQHHELPHFFSRAQRAYRALAYDGSAKHATHVVTVSEHARRGIIDRLGVAPDRVTAIHHGIDHARFSPTPTPDDAALELPREFIFFPANLWPHKNHATLIEALARVPGIDLVLTGQTYDAQDALNRHARRAGVADRVHHLGYLKTHELPILYRRARALVFPSLFEGFGVPPLEAMACGCPTAVSNAASLPEVVGDAAITFDPRDAAQLAQAIERVLDEGERLVEPGLAHARTFSWEASAAKHAAVYASAAATLPRTKSARYARPTSTSRLTSEEPTSAQATPSAPPESTPTARAGTTAT
ncbi:glycosyltransferase family 4 protein [Solirubrobacter sp. CPCC 204708]|nr:glycosyltransferase family 4 protein [Solirubrobacter deserti]